MHMITQCATAASLYSSSFKITAVCREVGEMYEPQLWPEGTFVRRFFEVRKPRVAAGPVGDHARNVVSVNETVM